jgi:hypothetical protein
VWLARMIWVKLFFLGVRQLSKPLAARISAGAKGSPTFSTVLAAVGRQMHRATIQVTRASEGKASLRHVLELSEQKAVERGADILSEFVIYSVAGTTVCYEWNLTRKEKENKAEKEKAAELARRCAAAQRAPHRTNRMLRFSTPLLVCPGVPNRLVRARLSPRDERQRLRVCSSKRHTGPRCARRTTASGTISGICKNASRCCRRSCRICAVGTITGNSGSSRRRDGGGFGRGTWSTCIQLRRKRMESGMD